MAAYLNMVMVGRLDRRLYLQGVGSSTLWPGEIERRNVPVGLPVSLQQDSYLPTDATSFYLLGVPVLNAFTGVHGDYSTPRDTPGRINYDGAARIAWLMALLTRSVALRAEAPDYVAMEKPAGTPTRRNLQAYLGTIPEYGESNRPGVKLNGVAEAGPAAQAGLKSGDVIIELAGKPIENIYDYTYALNALKVGSAVEIVVQRHGEALTFSVTPARRE
jgi:membrane-associated protease RseP (regulator of RpoE activity)